MLPFSTLNAQPQPSAKPTNIQTPHQNWNFEFTNMDENPIDIEVADAFYFDADNPNTYPIFLPKTHINGATFNENTGIQYDRLRSNIDLANQAAVRIIVYQNNRRTNYFVTVQLKNNIPYVHVIWHGGTLASQKDNYYFSSGQIRGY